MSARVASAASLGLAGCHVCGLVSRLPAGAHASRCPRCGAPLHSRKPDSIGRTWALLLAACVLYVPANVLPVTITTSLTGTQADTIMSGVIFFWTSGAPDLALIIFTASVVVPLAKILALGFLALSVQRRSRWDPLQRARLYRWVEFVGKWSMLDVFVVALLATLVRFSALASIQAGPGAVAFCAVVIVTMFAAMSFDPRLLWDAADGREAASAPGDPASGRASADG